MKDLENRIEEAAIQASRVACSTSEYKFGFVKGVKSPEAKEYWQQKMYTENEVWNLIFSCVNMYLDWFKDAILLKLPDKPDLLKWFEQNKKK